jgi:hypothetical protein
MFQSGKTILSIVGIDIGKNSFHVCACCYKALSSSAATMDHDASPSTGRARTEHCSCLLRTPARQRRY